METRVWLVASLALAVGCVVEVEGEERQGDFAAGDDESGAKIAPPEMEPPDDGDDGGTYTGGGGSTSTYFPPKVKRLSYPNYEDFKRGACRAGRTPGDNPLWYPDHYSYLGTEWDNTGVCASRVPYTTERALFHDGCTGAGTNEPRQVEKGPWAGWVPGMNRALFYGACVLHDLCYKSEPSHSGWSKQQCEDYAYTKFQEVCNRSYYYNSSGWNQCMDAADQMYNTLDGDANWKMKRFEAFDTGEPWKPADICRDGYAFDVVSWRCEPATSSSGSSGGSTGGGGGGGGGGEQELELR